MSFADKSVGPLVVLLALLLLANGGFMLANPPAWYLAIDGVPDTGPMNPHFIRDIAFIYLGTGVALVLGWRLPDQRLGLFGLSAAWHLAHAGFHVWEVAVGICGVEALQRDFLGITLPSLLMLWLTVTAYRQRAAAG